MTKAEKILSDFIDDVENPALANGAVAIRHAAVAKAYFQEIEDAAIQKRSTEKKVPRTGSKGGNEPKDAPEVGGGDAPRQETASSHKAFRGDRLA